MESPSVTSQDITQDDQAEYPECEKLKRLRPRIDTISEFLDWLEGEDLHICGQNDNEFFYRYMGSFNSLIEKHLGISSTKLDNERRAMLQKCYDMNDGK